MDEQSAGFDIFRQLNASPEAMWQAWVDPDVVARWWHPVGATTPRDSVEIDARVGGRYRYTMVDEAGSVVTGGTYLDVRPRTRLQFTWGEPDAAPEAAPVVTLTFTRDEGGTSLLFELAGVRGTPGDGNFYDGWASALDSLAAEVEG